jgi:ribonuclease HI
MAINKPFNRNKQLAILLDEIASLDTPYHIKWVKAHVCIAGNERADELAKTAANDTTLPEFSIPWSRSLLKSKLKSAIMEE